MKYRFNPQKSILVAGLMATAYAQACYVQVSTGITCESSGATVDSFTWVDGAAASVIATSNFTQDVVKPGGPGYTTFTQHYCAGPAKITDRSGHVNTLNYWEAGSINGNVPFPGPNGTWGDVVTTTTCS